MWTLRSLNCAVSIIFLAISSAILCGCSSTKIDMHRYLTNSTCDIKVINELPGGRVAFGSHNASIYFSPPLDAMLKDYMCNNVSRNLDYKNLYVTLKNAKVELMDGDRFIPDMISTLDAQYSYKYGGKSIIQDVSVHKVEQENGFTGRKPDVNFIELIKQLDLKIKNSIKAQMTP